MENDVEITFGDRVAENESTHLANYFMKTAEWKEVRKGAADVVFGSKGAGKSALYTLLVAETAGLAREGVTLLSAEKPKGKTVFSEIRNIPPTSESEFVTLWKIYVAQLIVQHLVKIGKCTGAAYQVKEKLVEAGLIEEQATLKRMVNSAMEFARRLMKIESLEGGGSLIDFSVTGKITFQTPNREKRERGFLSIDELLEKLNLHLEEYELSFWILFDRLDVAFDEDQKLEENALRALFKAYRDIEDLEAISLKIFLRDDIWKRITDEGFRESSHITRTTSIKWSAQSLLNMIVLRLIQNPSVVSKYEVNVELVEQSHEEQRSLYYKIFPEQVDVGEKQSDTFDWIFNRAKDGFGNAAPREIIHFHNEVAIKEKSLRSIGATKVEEPNLFSRQAIKAATYEVSKVKIEQNLFAENARLKPFILKLDGNKAEHNIETLTQLWGVTEIEAKGISTELVGIGFFEQPAAREEGIFKIPFIYRPYLKITQGKAFQ